MLAVGARLFTFEALLRDDPTVALVVRGSPALENRRVLEDSGELAGAWVLLQDENGWPGRALYRWVVRVGWAVIPTLWLAVWIALAFKTRRTRAPSAHS